VWTWALQASTCTLAPPSLHQRYDTSQLATRYLAPLQAQICIVHVFIVLY
jgi:hypothetical protein